MDAFLHQVLSGLANGAIYASIALALVMIYKATHHVNFAQGELAMFATYMSWTLIQAHVPYWIAFFATLVIAFFLGAVIERVIMRWVHDAPVLTSVAIFIGILIFINALAGLLFEYQIKPFPSPFPDKLLTSRFLNAHEAGMIGVTLLVLLIVFLFFRYTKLGLAMRASAENPQSSKLVGVRVGQMLALGWGLAAALGAVAGMMAAPVVYLEPNMMGGILNYGFAAALLGGIDNPWGAVLGGFIVGVIENLAGAYVVGTQLKLAVALALIVAVVTFKPAGLFGRKIVVPV